jgi:hypothetical protein
MSEIFDNDDLKNEISDLNRQPEYLGAAGIYDYIDSRGEQLRLASVDEEYLEVAVIHAGGDPALAAVFNETSDARKFAEHIIEWADDIEEARKDPDSD